MANNLNAERAENVAAIDYEISAILALAERHFNGLNSRPLGAEADSTQEREAAAAPPVAESGPAASGPAASGPAAPPPTPIVVMVQDVAAQLPTQNDDDPQAAYDPEDVRELLQDIEIEVVNEQAAVEKKRARSPSLAAEGEAPAPKKLRRDEWSRFFENLLKDSGMELRKAGYNKSCLYVNNEGESFTPVRTYFLTPPVNGTQNLKVSYKENRCAENTQAFVHQMGHTELIINYHHSVHSGLYIVTHESHLSPTTRCPTTWINHLFGRCQRHAGHSRQDAEGSSTLHHKEGAMSIETVNPLKRKLMQANPRQAVEMMQEALEPCSVPGKVHISVPLSTTNEYLLRANSPVVKALKERGEYTPTLFMVRWSWTSITKLMSYLYQDELNEYPDYVNSVWESSFEPVDRLMSMGVGGKVVQLFREDRVDYLLVVHLQGDLPLLL